MLRAILSNINDMAIEHIMSVNGEQGLVIYDEKTGQDYTVSADILNLNYKSIPINYIFFDGKGLDLSGVGYKFYKKGDYVGYISNTCFSERDAYISLQHLGSNKLNTKGLTFYFWQNLPNEITITYYRSGPESQEILTSDVYFPNDIIFCCEKEVENWDIVEIYFSFYNGSNYLKLYDIRIGEISLFNRFFDFNILEEINILSDDLSINSCDFTVESKENLIEKEGNKVQILKNERGFGFFTLQDCQQLYTNKYSLQSYGSISKLENAQFTYPPFNFEVPLDFLIQELKEISEVDIELDNAFDGYTIYGFISKCTCRYALMQICWAIGGIVDSSRVDKIKIKPIPTKISSIIKTEDKRIIGDALFKKSEPITKAIWDIHNYIQPFESEESVLLSIEAVGASVQTNPPTFFELQKFWDKPVLITKFQRIEGEVDEAKIMLTTHPSFLSFATLENGTYNFIGSEYVDNVTSLEIINPDIAGNIKENIKTFDKFTLYAKDQNGDYDFKKKDIQNFIRSKGTVTAKIVLKNEKVGDLISIETAFSGVITGIIVSMNLNLTYSNIADIEVLEWNSGMI